MKSHQLENGVPGVNGELVHHVVKRPFHVNENASATGVMVTAKN